MNILLALAIALAVGLAFTRVCKKISLPNVTGYLIAGLLIGPFCFRCITQEQMQSFESIITLALGFIAFSIGGEFKLSSLKLLGKQVMTITFMQALTTTLLVDVGLILFGFETPLALTLGAIATATAPAATLMVVRQYKAKGPVTKTLLPVVALDDAIGLMVFSISLAVARALGSGEAVTLQATLVEPVVEIVLSLLIGGAIGFALALAMRFFRSHANRLCLILTAVVLGTALAEQFDLSSLLLCMSIGAVLVNLRDDAEKLLTYNDDWTPPLFLLFFVLSGADLDLTALPAIGLLGVLYLVLRSAGKYIGARMGARVVHAQPNICKYLGITLFPQAGVAIGMSQIVISALPAYGAAIRTVVLCATLIYELVGPLLTKIALTKAGEIVPAKRAGKQISNA